MSELVEFDFRKSQWTLNSQACFEIFEQRKGFIVLSHNLSEVKNYSGY
jgi:hypothetical protein